MGVDYDDQNRKTIIKNGHFTMLAYNASNTCLYLPYFKVTEYHNETGMAHL